MKNEESHQRICNPLVKIYQRIANPLERERTVHKLAVPLCTVYFNGALITPRYLPIQ